MFGQVEAVGATFEAFLFHAGWRKGTAWGITRVGWTGVFIFSRRVVVRLGKWVSQCLPDSLLHSEPVILAEREAPHWRKQKES